MAIRAYTASASVSVTGSWDLMEIAPVSNKTVIVHGWHIGAAGGTADAADAQEELLRVTAGANLTATGSGGSTVTSSPMNQSDAACGATVKSFNSTIAGGSFNRTFADMGWNNRAGDTFWFTPEMRPSIGNPQVFELRLSTAPADALIISATVWFEEVP